MNITITGEEVAEVIAKEIEQATGLACEVCANGDDSVLVHDHTTSIARVTEMLAAIAVAPLCGPFVGDITWIPLEARNLDSIREVGQAIENAASHALNAALNH